MTRDQHAGGRSGHEANGLDVRSPARRRPSAWAPTSPSTSRTRRSWVRSRPTRATFEWTCRPPWDRCSATTRRRPASRSGSGPIAWCSTPGTMRCSSTTRLPTSTSPSTSARTGQSGPFTTTWISRPRLPAIVDHRDELGLDVPGEQFDEARDAFAETVWTFETFIRLRSWTTCKLRPSSHDGGYTRRPPRAALPRATSTIRSAGARGAVVAARVSARHLWRFTARFLPSIR